MILKWFLVQKRQTKILIISGLVVLFIILYFAIKAGYWKYQYFKDQEKQVKELSILNKQLKKDVDAIAIDRKLLQKTINDQTIQIDSLKIIAKTLKNETITIPDVVRTYPDRKLDSILTNYRHPKRTQN